MVDLLSIRSIFLHDSKVYNFKIFFGPNFDIQEAYYNLLNKYVIYKFNQYKVMNIKNYSL